MLRHLELVIVFLQTLNSFFFIPKLIEASFFGAGMVAVEDDGGQCFGEAQVSSRFNL
jgi:hypothetical protein